MKKPKKPNLTNAAAQDGVPDEALAQRLCLLALDLKAVDIYANVPDDLQKKKSETRKLIKKCLQQGKDATLDEALERAAEEDEQAYVVLRAEIEQLSENIVLRRDEGPDLEVNAFVIPFFVRSAGGLRAEESFQDEDAFERLRASIQQAQLESRKASVVLVSHAYHLDELDRIGYSMLSAMVLEAYDAMTRKKAVAAQAIACSMRGWPEQHYGADEQVVELRFLLGFTLKSLDDPFYQVPQKEAAADRYFEARAERFRLWAREHADVLKRCLARPGRELDLDFLYQDLFYGGKAAAVSELETLQMMSELQRALDEGGHNPGAVHAVVGPAEADELAILRVNLYDASDALLVSSEKPIARGAPLDIELDDVCDALRTIGVARLACALRFDDEGRPVDTRPYTA